MKNILKVTILFCILISIFTVSCFASDDFPFVVPVAVAFKNNGDTLAYVEYTQGANTPDFDFYVFRVNNTFYTAADYSDFNTWYSVSGNTIHVVSGGSGAYPAKSNFSIDNTYNIASYGRGVTFPNNQGYWLENLPSFASKADGIAALRYYLDNPPPIYTKNENVDEFIANTLISMGVKFDTPAYALSYASAAWDWCIDEENVESAHPFDEWNIDTFVSYCNAQSNNYLNWYNGYKLHEDVTKALGEYIRQNIRSLTGLPAGITSLQGAYLPIYHYGSGFESGVSSPSANTFYPSQTITYFNGEYLNDNDDISTSQFLYTPPDVRRFLGYPATGSIVIPSDPAAGTGTITDDPNNPDQKNIEINFPSLDWLADAINSILDFLRNALTTLADLLTQLLDAILGLFSDAFAGLEEFGQGFIEFMQSVFAGFSDILSGFVPTDLATILITFLALNIGIGLITFVLKGH